MFLTNLLKSTYKNKYGLLLIQQSFNKTFKQRTKQNKKTLRAKINDKDHFTLHKNCRQKKKSQME